MLTVYTAMCTNPVYAAMFDFKPAIYPDGRPFVPHAVALNCGIYQVDMHGKKTSFMTKGLMRALLRKHGSPEEMRQINPIPYITAAFPRTFIMTANHDSLAGSPAQKGMTAKLQACGVPFVEKMYGTEEEPLEHVFHCNIRTQAAKACNDDECRFFVEKMA